MDDSTLNPALDFNNINTGSVEVSIHSSNRSFAFDLFHTDQVMAMNRLNDSQFADLASETKATSKNAVLLDDVRVEFHEVLKLGVGMRVLK